MVSLLVVLLAADMGERLILSDVPSLRESRAMKYVSEAVQPSRAANTPARVASADDASKDGVIVVQGIFDSAGEKLLRLQPVHRYAYRSKTTPDQREGRFAVKVTFMSGMVTTAPFDALVADDAGHTAHGFFEIVIPVSDDIRSICITDANGRKIFACVDGSEVLR